MAGKFGGVDLTNLTQTGLNAWREADALKQAQEMAAIEHQEGENAIAGAKVNLQHNQMRRYNDGQKAMGQLG
ncbi:hypothetical protein LT85_0499 [Collimonas arenae]|uniref:Uncharacterized protein n=1 Tax=Collimonas arenae TaxID=279058 RepID=A0A0A1F7J5_9BURK|nr:hypothetical protein [Collimonas arenae]AIY39659.1 hypothetical protein LT85_0499 [Collimonas arenae]